MNIEKNEGFLGFFIGKYLVLLVVLTVRYFVIAGTYFFLTQKAFFGKARSSIVNPSSHFRDQIKFEIKYSMVTVFVFAVGGLNFILAKELGIGQIYLDFHERGLSYFIASIFLMLLVNDLYFYWTHRWLHSRKMFRNYHSIHHRSRVTTPWTSQSFHWMESAINVFIAVLFPYLFPIHPTAYVIFTFIAFLNNIYGHGNFDFVPMKWRGKIPFLWLNSPSVHGFHHENVDDNYGLYTNIWDRLHGTYKNPSRLSQVENKVLKNSTKIQ